MSARPDLNGSGTIPTYRYGWAPPTLATRRQLRALGLRPGGQDPVAQLLWRRGRRRADLYEIAKAAKVRPMTPRRWRAVARALLARHTCRTCGEVFEHCLPRSTGWTCPPCAERIPADPEWEVAA
ncbi:RRQRL motif-containing zinc-binding protein [Marinactinospora rubrisoli]|uniref:RRQRL motif-containing zinc-binding protein n=1 Tax=Marinactinospora rubrisoli TaxID=2715399 RepID=A0ABW2KPP9_9ACTN